MMEAETEVMCLHAEESHQKLGERQETGSPSEPPKNKRPWVSLVAQWLRIRLPMQGTRVRALVQEDPTCRGATKPMHHNY